MSGLKIQGLPLEKSEWDNVPSLVFKSFHTVASNLAAVKKWADRQDEKTRNALEQHNQLVGRVESAEATLKATQARLEEITANLDTITSDQRETSETFAVCISQQLRASSALFGHFGRTFGVSVEDAVAIGSGSTPTPSVETSSPRPPSQPSHLSGEAGPSALAQSLSLAELRGGSNSLEALAVGPLREVFDKWGAGRVDEDSQRVAMQGTIEELQIAVERTRERLLAWREMLKESSHVIDSLGTSLANTRSAVQELQTSQVRREDVDEAVGKRAVQLEDLHGKTEQRVDTIFQRVEAHVAEVENLVREARRHAEERIDEHGRHVSAMVERNMNPVNAYLNTMHIKADNVRQELDGLSTRVPQLASAIDGVTKELRQRDDVGQKRADTLEGLLTQLADSVSDLTTTGQDQYEKHTNSLEALTQEMHEELGGLREALDETSSQVAELKGGALAGVSKDLLTLEQKVAKWVHAHPLPAKVSEARLYSLEARLAEETDARLHLEYKIKDKVGRLSSSGQTPRTTNGSEQLPQLAQAPPLQASPRPAIYDNWRAQAGGPWPPGSAPVGKDMVTA